MTVLTIQYQYALSYIGYIIEHILILEIPAPNRSKKMAHFDAVEEKIKFDMEMKKKQVEHEEAKNYRDFDIRERELRLKEKSQEHDFEIRKKELELEERRLALSAQTTQNSSLMLKLMEELISLKK